MQKVNGNVDYTFRESNTPHWCKHKLHQCDVYDSAGRIGNSNVKKTAQFLVELLFETSKKAYRD